LGIQLRRLSSVAGRIIVISEFTAKQLRQQCPSLKDKISVVHDGINKDIFYRRKRKIGQEKGYILFVSGFDVRKNVNNLLKAYLLLAQKGVKNKLLLKGVVEEGIDYYMNVPSIVQEMGLNDRVVIESRYMDDNDLAELYSNAALLVLPSFIEGFGLPVLEAMACGCPVACSNAASLPEVGGDAALYFDPQDPAGMAVAMERILAEPGLKQVMREKGYANAKKFSWDKMARLILEAVHDAAGTGTSAKHCRPDA
jgi:glycosyltransferase involved in cell wall biosynthesis